MRLLFTNYQLISGTGTEQVLKDLAIAFQAKHYQVAIYCPRVGWMAEQIRAQGIQVVSRLDHLGWKPDLIHGHHHVETLEALQAFPDARGLFVCHDGLVWHDFPPRHPRLLAYVAVDLNVSERMKFAGISKVRMIGNWVDTKRFARRQSLPSKPQRALIFSNYSIPGGAIEEIQAACHEKGIECNMAGQRIGRHLSKPEEVLGNYDLIFGAGKCAFEALSTGAAVILYLPFGCGPLITTRNMADLLPWNFGLSVMTEPVLQKHICREIDRYDSKNALAVSDWVRRKADIGKAIEAYRKLYDDLLARPMPLQITSQFNSENDRAESFLKTVPSTEAHKKLAPEEMQAVDICITEAPPRIVVEENFPIRIELTNNSAKSLSSEEPFPVNVSYHWLDAVGNMVTYDGIRTRLPRPLASNDKMEIWTEIIAPELEGDYRLQITCVQEGVLWFDQVPKPVFAETNLSIRSRRKWIQNLRLSIRKAVSPPPAILPPMPIIVGSPRSGTTLLRFMLDAHPLLAIPPETNFLSRAADLLRASPYLKLDLFELITQHAEEAPSWPDFQLSKQAYWEAIKDIEPFDKATGFREFYRLYARENNKPRWGDKTPLYALHIEAIGKLLPEARFIHIIRDGRDTALSLRNLWFSPGESMEAQAKFWSHNVTNCRAQGLKHGRYLEVYYEHLIADPIPILQKICDFIELRYDPQMMRYPESTPKRLKEHGPRVLRDGTVIVRVDQRLRQQQLTTSPPDLSRIQAWRQDMSPEEVTRFEVIAGEALRAFGYETST